MNSNRWELNPAKLMPPSEVDRLLSTVHEQAAADYAANRKTWIARALQIELMSNAGLRVSEVASLHVEDLDLDSEYPTLWIANGKARNETDAPEPVHLAPRTAKLLQTYIERMHITGYLFPDNNGGHIKKRTIQHGFKVALRLAELPERYGVHSLRHSFGTRTYRTTKNLRLVQKQLRHRSVTTTTRYADVLAEDIAAAMADTFPEEEN